MKRPWLLAVLLLSITSPIRADDAPWKAGVGSQIITPTKFVWMAGYAGRTKPPDGKLHDLHAKALALEDPDGNRCVILTLDLVGITRTMRDAVAKKVEQQWKLPNRSLLINASHTHCGPLVRSRPSVTYELTDAQWAEVDEYLLDLEKNLVAVVGKALEDLRPAKLGYRHARAGFAMNRRLPSEKGYQNSPYPDGPVDHDVPVLRVEDPKGALRAILFGYACHNTTLGIQQYSGDYAGFAQEYLQESHPNVTALFLMGCGGDQNPYPRGTVELARQHGRTLATAVDAALLPKARPVTGRLRTAFEEVTLQFVPLSRDELLKMSMGTDKYDLKRSKQLLAELEKSGQLKATYAYPIQVLRFGKDLTILGLAGEVVVDYSLRFKKEFADAPLWVAGYSNDVFGYVPSLRVLKEGGYEGGGAMRFGSHPGPFAASVEDRIVGGVRKLIEATREK